VVLNAHIGYREASDMTMDELLEASAALDRQIRDQRKAAKKG